MAIIKRIVTGQTFGNWLDTTNKMIDDLNAANPLRNVDKLVRYDGGGSIGTNTLRLRDFHLDSNTNISIDTLSSDFTNVGFENDNTIFTAKATYEAIKAEAKNIIKNAFGHAVSSEYVQVHAANVETVIGGTQQIVTTSANTTFSKDVVIKGDLSVLGDSTEFQTQVLSVEDNNILLNRGGSKTTAERAGFDIDSTSAFFRLVDSGNRFPYDQQSGTPNLVPIKLYDVDEIRNFYVDSSKTLDDMHFQGSQLTGPAHGLRKININKKDSLTLTYQFYAGSTLPTNALMNAVPMAIGTSAGAGREANVLEPDPNDHRSTANSQVTYSIGTDYFTSYADYKQAFLNEPIDSDRIAKIVFTPNSYSTTGNTYYYWAGEVAPQVYECLTDYNTTANNVIHDIKKDGSFLENNALNKDFKIALGDTVKFSIRLTTLQQIDSQRKPFFIGTQPFNYSPGLNDRFALNNLVFDQSGTAFSDDVTYEIDGVIYNNQAPHNKGLADYISDFQTGTWANVTFQPNSLDFASQYTFHYFNTANNHGSFSHDFGGTIEVSANNTGMGAELNVIYPMGLLHTRTLSPSSPNIDFGGVTNGDLTIDAGDTLELDVTPFLASNNPVDIKSGTTPQEGTHGIIYEIDGTKYGLHTDYASAWSSSASSAKIYITPHAAGTLTYSSTGLAGTGTITVNAEKASSLSSFHLSTDTDHAAIENPLSFTFTKNHNPILVLDGDTANFAGTARGIQLPADALNSPAANGVIRYNDGIGLFEGFTGGTWRGLGGVIDLNQDTSIAAHDSDDILQFNTNGQRISEMEEDQFFLKSFPKTVSANTGNTSIESNANPGKFTITSTGDVDYDGGTSGTQTSSMTIQPNGIHIDSTGFMKIPIGTKTERPSTPSKGMIRFAEDSVQLHSRDVLDGVAQPILKESLEYYNGTDWITLSTIKNEFSITVPSDSQYVTFKNIHRPFKKYEIDIFINGLRIPKVDIVNITEIQTSSTPDYYDCKIEFSSQRKAGQIITVIQVPQRYLGETTAGFLSKGELVNGLSDPIALLGQVDIGVGTDTTSIGSGALVVTGGIGISGGITIGKSLIELSAGELKENVKPIESALEKVQKLNGVEFTWKDEQKRDLLPEYGLIAENVANIVPSLASFDREKPTGVKYSKVVALLIEAVKQQQSEINELRSQIPKKRTRKTTTSKNS